MSDDFEIEGIYEELKEIKKDVCWLKVELDRIKKAQTSEGGADCWDREKVEALFDNMRRAELENALLKKDLERNAKMLARQCDLARDAEAESMRLANIINRQHKDCESLKAKLENCQEWMECPYKYNGCLGKALSRKCTKNEED